MLLEGTLSTAGVPQDFVTSSTERPSSVAPAGPETCHRHVVGLPVLVLVSVMFPLRGVFENDTVDVPVAGLKFATTGTSATVIVCCTVSLETPSLTWS